MTDRELGFWEADLTDTAPRDYVVLSNCVISLCVDEPVVHPDAFRVLVPRRQDRHLCHRPRLPHPTSDTAHLAVPSVDSCSAPGIRVGEGHYSWRITSTGCTGHRVIGMEVS